MKIARILLLIKNLLICFAGVLQYPRSTPAGTKKTFSEEAETQVFSNSEYMSSLTEQNCEIVTPCHSEVSKISQYSQQGRSGWTI